MKAIKGGKFSQTAHASRAKGGSDMGERFDGLARQAMRCSTSGKPSWVSAAQWARKGRSRKS